MKIGHLRCSLVKLMVILYLLSFTTTYRANGKLLLTGEYLVLHGAKAIALPLKVGQQLTAIEGGAAVNGFRREWV